MEIERKYLIEKEQLPKNLHFSESVLLNYSMFFFLSDGTNEHL